ncbi:hypothetical protein [Rachiplusia nu nucleopolyhedrovirus]|uniref:Uncharacterized protein n=1 Tax=Rachiplusia nu nucleopolyhedrovirus TaxID=2605775 RepID=A0AAF1DB46_9ABAC|nr:hypothetical protein QKQ55_gp020 [Rachiplusia nu nucleopolyhedrovirus]QEI03646.1 hypothetical protein [Rachiplusia nu nucleopolyhedrovirus]
MMPGKMTWLLISRDYISSFVVVRLMSSSFASRLYILFINVKGYYRYEIISGRV